MLNSLLVHLLRDQVKDTNHNRRAEVAPLSIIKFTREGTLEIVQRVDD